MFRQIYLVLLLSVAVLTNTTARDVRHLIDSFKTVVKTSPDSSKAEHYYYLSQLYSRVSIDSCEMYAKTALKLAKELDDKPVIASSYSMFGLVAKNRGNYEEAIKHHLESLKIMEEYGNPYGMAVSYNDIGVLYKQMQRWDEALQYYRKSNEITLRKGYDRGIAMTYNNIGTIFQQKQMWDSATYYYDSGYYYAEKAKSSGAMATALANIGEVKLEQKNYNEALDAFVRCLSIDKQNEDKYGMQSSYFQIGKTYAALNKHFLAAKYIDTAETIAKQQKLTKEVINILIERVQIEEALGNYQKALSYSTEATQLKDSILNAETSKQVSELTTQYETEKKEQQILLQQAEISKKNYIIAGISALLLLALLLGISYYNRYKLKQQDKLQKTIIKQQELATEAVIEAEERERKRIAGDLHDGVGQTMSAAKMNLSVISNEIPFKDEEQKLAFDKAVALVDEGCSEVRTVSHNIMPNALLKAGLTTAIKEFLNKIDSKVLQVNLYTEGLNERLPSNIETVLYRVVQECVNNVIKHAEANTLDMTIIKDDQEISLTIEDNGKGFDMNNAKRKDGIGLQNLITRINYLKGTIEWDTAPGKGTVVIINVPASI